MAFGDLWPVVAKREFLERDDYWKHDLDVVYRERTFVVAALARTMFRHPEIIGGDAWLSRHVGPWEDDWRWIVCIDLGEPGIVTWHIHDSELTLFRFLDAYEAGEVDEEGNQRTAPEYVYDGHSTADKYRRIWEYVTGERE